MSNKISIFIYKLKLLIKRMQLSKNLIITILVIFGLNIAFYFTSDSITVISEQSCFDNLKTSAIQISSKIYNSFSDDTEELNFIANIIAEQNYINSDDVIKILSKFKENGTISKIEILYPDNHVLKKNGHYVDVSDIISFEDEAAKGQHISNLQEDTDDRRKKILRNYVPIVKDGKTVALLCGIIERDRMLDLFKVDNFGNRANYYIIESESGNFIIDTSRSESYEKDEESFVVKQGYSIDKMNIDILRRTGGDFVFFSKNYNEYLYCWYESIRINDWVVMVYVPEKVALQVFNKIKETINTLSIFNSIVFIIYLVYMVKYTRNENYERQKSLDIITYMYDIEKMLFDAYREPKHIQEALKKVANMISAEKSFFIILKGTYIDEVFLWSKSSEKKDKNLFVPNNIFGFFSSFTRKIDSLIIRDIKTIKNSYPNEYRLFKQNDIYSMILSPVFNINGDLIGILAAANMKYRYDNAEFLENVSLSFSMLHNNMGVYNKIKEMGEMDALTGLLNRNSYQNFISGINMSMYNSLSCIYIDANGLHDLNNSLGHEAGDKMLKCIADLMKREFGTEHSYRIGGDEFVAFFINRDKSDIEFRIKNLKEDIIKNGYFVSVGLKWNEDDEMTIDDIIKSAEQEMYREKNEYYSQKGSTRVKNWKSQKN